MSATPDRVADGHAGTRRQANSSQGARRHRPGNYRTSAEILEPWRVPDRRAGRPPDRKHEAARGEDGDGGAGREKAQEDTGDERTERGSELRDRRANALDAPEQPVRGDRDAVADHDGIRDGHGDGLRQDPDRQNVDARPDEKQAASKPRPELDEDDRTRREGAPEERRQQR